MASHAEQPPSPPEGYSSVRILNAITDLPACCCDTCQKEINLNTLSYRCSDCEDYDLCQSCFTSGQRCPTTAHGFKRASFADYMQRPRIYKHYHSLFYKDHAHTIDEAQREIRVLHVHQTDSYDAPIEACLRVESLDKWPSYYALSYTWGSTGATQVMKIGSAPIAITKNLESALKRIRSIKEQFRIWVDALCINQSDNNERASQVKLMGTIYSRASSVFVYLGEHSRECLSKPPFSNGLEQKVLEELDSDVFSSEIREERQNLFRDIIDRPWFTRTWVVQEATLNLRVDIICGSLLIDLPKFLARNENNRQDASWTPWAGLMSDHAHRSVFTLFLLRKLSINWFSRDISTMLSKLDSATRYLRERPEQAEDEGFDLTKVDQLEQVVETLKSDASDVVPREYKLINLLSDFRRLSASDPRDKIYATLGLATDASDTPEISYELSPADVFRKFAAYLVRKGDGLRVLHAATSHPQTMELPSWVPDWSSRLCHFNPLDSFLRPDIRAGGTVAVKFHISAEEHSLEFSGCIADHIWFIGCALTYKIAEEMTDENISYVTALLDDQVCAPDEDGRVWSVRDGIKTNRLDRMRNRNRAFWYPKWLLWLSIVIYMKELAYTGAFSRRDQVRSSGSLYREEGSRSPGTDLPHSFSESKPWSLGDLETIFVEAVDPAALKPPQHPADKEFESKGVSVGPKDLNYVLLENRRLCITRTGRLGLVPDTAQEGDEILVFSGAVTPFVVRKLNDSRKPVGDCYIRGIMHGEGLLEDRMELITIS